MITLDEIPNMLQRKAQLQNEVKSLFEMTQVIERNPSKYVIGHDPGEFAHECNPAGLMLRCSSVTFDKHNGNNVSSEYEDLNLELVKVAHRYYLERLTKLELLLEHAAKALEGVKLGGSTEVS